ncbi:hypothetical protein GOBAR_AA33943 [Gossypium barbadense]|uniref:Uncharacterized protein n=1 Tax=Gossypium barbadense TaxID=3634 RepID=A0A2P5W6P7_GOSBA|nr:hypothetical protein GOBAR_AA33943 [Gossypium barbadense]
MISVTPDLDDIPKDIDNEGPVEGENANPHSTGNTGPGIVKRKNPGSYMTDVDPDTAFAREFSEYTNIVTALLLDDEFGDEELFVGQQFDNKKDCLHAIKHLALMACPSCVNVVDTNVDDKETRRSTDMHVRSYFARPWKVRCKTICNCITPLVKESPTIQDVSYNKLQGWIAGMQKYVPEIMADLQTLPITCCDKAIGGSMEMTTNLVEAVNSVLRRIRHLPISVVFLVTFYKLATLMPKMRLRQAKQIEAGHVYIEAIRKAMTSTSAVVRVFHLGRMQLICKTGDASAGHFRHFDIRGNEFPIMHDVSNWEVPSLAFEMVPTCSLRRHPKGRPQSMRI